jgi:TonB family protein
MHYRLIAALLISVLATNSTAQSGAKTKPPENCEEPESPGHNITPPRLVDAPGPEYPLMATESPRAKTVVLLLVVGTNGRACGPQVQQSAGPEFERAALRAIRDWKWKPATKDGVPVAFRTAVEMSFQRLKNSNAR